VRDRHVILSLLLLIAPASGTSDVLMLGNSYTQQQNLPGALQQVFEAAGESTNVEGLTSGGLTLADHADNAQDKTSAWYEELVTHADQREWVVLQDQSQIPGFPETTDYWQDSVAGAESLNALAAEAGAETMFFMTWGYRDGDEMNPTRYTDFATMQDLLTAGYLAYVEATSAKGRPTWVAPVGLSLAHIYNSLIASGGDPSNTDSAFYTLYSNDGKHPSASGNYLAACVFYAAITGKSPAGLEGPTSLEVDEAAYLQDVAAATVFAETDALDYPWEDGQTPQETGDTGDTGTHDTGQVYGGPVDPGFEESNYEGCGCSASANVGAVWMLGVVLLGGLRRRSLTPMS
jgi:MYXO-CTERM domain-containing protein